MADSEPEFEDGVKKKSKKKHEEAKVDSEGDDGKKRKIESGSDVIRNSESSEVKESNEDSMKDAVKEKKKKKKKKEKKHNVDSEVEDNNLNSTKDAKKKSKEKKQSEDSEAEEDGLNSTKDAKKKRKKKKKKKKQESGESDKDVTTPSSKSTKKVKFSDQLETFHFPIEDEEEEEGKLVRGKRYTEEEDEQIKKAVHDYIDKHGLGDDGIDMVMKCKSHPQLKGCWKEIASALPWRPYESVYNRALSIFEAGSKRVWKKEDYELLFELYKKHGNDWRTIGDASMLQACERRLKEIKIVIEE